MEEMNEKYVEAYYRMKVLKDYIMLVDKYVSRDEILAILGVVDSVKDGHQE